MTQKQLLYTHTDREEKLCVYIKSPNSTHYINTPLVIRIYVENNVSTIDQPISPLLSAPHVEQTIFYAFFPILCETHEPIVVQYKRLTACDTSNHYYSVVWKLQIDKERLKQNKIYKFLYFNQVNFKYFSQWKRLWKIFLSGIF